MNYESNFNHSEKREYIYTKFQQQHKKKVMILELRYCEAPFKTYFLFLSLSLSFHWFYFTFFL